MKRLGPRHDDGQPGRGDGPGIRPEPDPGPPPPRPPQPPAPPRRPPGDDAGGPRVGASGRRDPATRRLAGSRPSRAASSTRVPAATTQRVATASTGRCRATRPGSVRRVRSRCQPPAVGARTPSSVRARGPDQQGPSSAGARSVGARHGASWPATRAATRVACVRLGASVSAVPAPTQACPGPGARAVAWAVLPPRGRQSVASWIRSKGRQPPSPVSS